MMLRDRRLHDAGKGGSHVARADPARPGPDGPRSTWRRTLGAVAIPGTARPALPMVKKMRPGALSTPPVASRSALPRPQDHQPAETGQQQRQGCRERDDRGTVDLRVGSLKVQV